MTEAYNYGAFLWQNPKMDYYVRSHGFFFAKETKNPKRD